MTIKRIEPGKRMSGAVVHGNTVYLAGQVGEGTKRYGTEQVCSLKSTACWPLPVRTSRRSCRRSSISPTCPPSAK